MRRSRFFVSTVSAALLLLAAACTKPPPPPPPPPSTLTITTVELPLAEFGQPYSFQLQTTGGAGPVTWTLLSGVLPTGLSLDSAGLISGTAPTGQPGEAAGGFVRVQATNGTASTTRLLMLVTGSPGPAPTGGTPLPEGNRIFSGAAQPLNCSPCAFVPFVYNADGTTTPLTTLSVQKAGELGGPSGITADGSKVVYARVLEGGDQAGPVEVLDGVSGAVLVTLEPDTAFQMGAARFSPDGSKVSLADQTGHVRIFDATNGAVLTSFQSTSPGNMVWSPDSNEITDGAYQQLPTVTIHSASGPGTRQVTNPADCNVVSGWSATNRLLLGCGSGIKTMSAVDGSDVHDIATSQTATLPAVMYAAPSFSPSGTRILLTEMTITEAPMILSGTRLLVASDVTASPFTELVSSSEAAVAAVAWT